jgi:hypothetical protein
MNGILLQDSLLPLTGTLTGACTTMEKVRYIITSVFQEVLVLRGAGMEEPGAVFLRSGV